MSRQTEREPGAIKWQGVFNVKCHNAAGELLWEEDCENSLFEEGGFAILDIALRGGTAPANWYVGLMKNTLAALPTVASTLATLNTAGPYELTNASDPGYARSIVNRDATAAGWPTLALNGLAYQATSKTVVFTNSNAAGGAAWADPIRWMFVTTVASTGGDTTGKLVSMAQLSVDRLLQGGDSLSITYNLKIS